MKIFISWSGERSHKVAQLLNLWLKCVIQAIEPWLSSKDIEKGSIWFTEISNQISETQSGIVCLTKTNMNAPWILFEAGALAKGLSTNRVFTFLIDLQPNEIRDPLAQFNHTLPNRENLLMLVRSINNGLGGNKLPEDILSKVFETYWPQFHSEFDKILNETPDEDVKIHVPENEILTEILYAVRAMEKRVRVIEDKNQYVRAFPKRKLRWEDFADKDVEKLNLSEQLLHELKKQNISSIRGLTEFKTDQLDNSLRAEFVSVIKKELEDMDIHL